MTPGDFQQPHPFVGNVHKKKGDCGSFVPPGKSALLVAFGASFTATGLAADAPALNQTSL